MKNIIDYLPKKTRKMIDHIVIEKNADYDDKTGKMLNRYHVYLNDGYINPETEEQYACFNTIAYMKWWLKEYVDEIR